MEWISNFRGKLNKSQVLLEKVYVRLLNVIANAGIGSWEKSKRVRSNCFGFFSSDVSDCIFAYGSAPFFLLTLQLQEVTLTLFSEHEISSPLSFSHFHLSFLGNLKIKSSKTSILLFFLKVALSFTCKNIIG